MLLVNKIKNKSGEHNLNGVISTQQRSLYFGWLSNKATVSHPQPQCAIDVHGTLWLKIYNKKGRLQWH